MRSKPALLVVAVLMLATASVEAQNFIRPAKDVAAPCTGCGGTREGLLTAPYTGPLVNHTGRYVDSSTTMNVQHMGMRTVRADEVRVSPATGRLYVEMGETIGSYSLSTFFTSRLAAPMTPVNVMNTGYSYGRYGFPLEKIATVNSFFYAEAQQSGWTTELIDMQVYMDDFDVDDRGYVYLTTKYFGWGVARDTGATDVSHMAFVSQVRNAPIVGDTLVAFKRGSDYFVLLSSTYDSKDLIYNVTSPASPTLVANRAGGIRAWSRYDATGRLALLGKDGRVRIYDYNGFVSGAAPLAEVAPTTGNSFKDLDFDDNGVLWVTESGAYTASSSLRRITPNANGYTNQTLQVLGAVWRAEQLDAGGNYIAVGGRSIIDGVNRNELRLFLVENGTPRLLDTEHFFRRFYHHPAAGYAPLPTVQHYINLEDVRLVTHEQKTYLMYSAMGIGDVFELGAEVTRVETSLAVSTTKNPGIAGQPVTIQAVLTPSSAVDALPTGSIRFKSGTTILGTAALSAVGNGTYRATFVHPGFPAGSQSLSADYAGDAQYRPAVSPSYTHVSCIPARITTAPRSASIFTGQTAKLTVRAAGSATLTYQWYGRANSDSLGEPISGATAASVNVSTAGQYWVIVTNGCGTAESSAVTVTINPIPALPPDAQKSGDFNNDGRHDVLWRYYATGRNTMWLMNGTTRTAADAPVLADLNWRTGAIGDFDLDGRADIFWRNSATGANTIWLMNGGTRLSDNVQAAVATNIVLAGSGDFDGDGDTDLFWRNTSNGANTIWLMSGVTPSSVATTTVSDQRWYPATFGDFDGDGRTDILWRNRNTGVLSMWLMNGATFTSAAAGTVMDLYWAPRGTADFNGDGRDDLMWRNEITGASSIWLMNGAAATVAPLPSAAAMWRPVAFGDFDGSGTADILWRNTSNGEIRLWLLNGATITSNTVLTSIREVEWSVEPSK